MLTLEEAKAYLRVDSGFEDELISALLTSSESICQDVARLTPGEWEAISEYTDGEVTIRGEAKNEAEVQQIRSLLRIGVLYALGYLYEHREDADHHDLTMTLRNLLFS